ncbi:MAG: hypothetical protein COA32_01570 [Fluviicola sp.]|nr:MAG: hypothetical protein COA32_01570 [Fluviicola sp.]
MLDKSVVINVYTPLLIGSIIYILFRGDSIFVKSWLDLKNHTIQSIKLPSWMIYSFQDGLWAYSFVSAMNLLWKNSKHIYLWLFISIILIFGHEVGQGAGIIHGTFDLVDIFFYCLGVILSLLFTSKKSNYETTFSIL